MRRLKNVTVTLDPETARWARIEAAKGDTRNMVATSVHVTVFYGTNIMRSLFIEQGFLQVSNVSGPGLRGDPGLSGPGECSADSETALNVAKPLVLLGLDARDQVDVL